MVSPSCPLPTAVEMALEILTEARHKRPYTSHVVVMPRIIIHMWIKVLGKNADSIIMVLVGLMFWDTNQYEPLVLALLLPIIRRWGW